MKTLFLPALLLCLAWTGCTTQPEHNKDRTTRASEPTTSGPSSAVLTELTGTEWTLVELLGQSAQPAVTGWPLQSLAFGADGQSATGHAGVNHFGARYSGEGKSLVFGPLALTRRTGPAAQLELEARYTQVLSRVVGWRQEGPNLVLQTPGAKRAAVLAPLTKAK